MIINKINAYNNAYLGFGKIKRNNQQNNNTDKQHNKKKKILLALGTIALTGAAIIAYNNPKIKSKFISLKKIPAKGNSLAESAEKISDDIINNAGFAAGGAAALIGAGVIMNKADELQGSSARKYSNPSHDKERTDEPSATDTPQAANSAVNKTEDIIENPSSEPIHTSETDKQAVSSDSNVSFSVDELSLNDFINKKGEFVSGKAYINSIPYSGNIVVQRKDKQKVLTYDFGELKSSLINRQKEDGSYEPVSKKTYSVDKAGTRTIVTRKCYTNSKGEQQWFKESIFKANDSEISVIHINHPFKDANETYLKREKNGKWVGYQEERGFDYQNGYYVLPKDIHTNKIISPRKFNKFQKNRTI